MKAFLLGIIHIVTSSPCEATQDNDGKMSDATKLCRRKCEWIDDQVVPRFDLWEKYCVHTYSDSYWDLECSSYYNCLLGCDIFKVEGARMTMSQESIQETLPEALDKELKCEVDQCKAFCVKWNLNTCREVQFSDACTKSKETAFYKCSELNCNAGYKLGPNGFLLFALLLLHVDAIGLGWFGIIKRNTCRCILGVFLTFCMVTGIWMALYLYSGNPIFGREEEVEENVWADYDKKLKEQEKIEVDEVSTLVNEKHKPPWKLPGDRFVGRTRHLSFFGSLSRGELGL